MLLFVGNFLLITYLHSLVMLSFPENFYLAPIIPTVDGLPIGKSILDREAELYIKQLAVHYQTNGNLLFRTLLAGSKPDFKFVFERIQDKMERSRCFR